MDYNRGAEADKKNYYIYIYSVRASPAECRTRLADSGKMMLKLLTAVTYQWGII